MKPPIKPLSEYLDAVAEQDLFDQETLEQANELPTADLQEQALDQYRAEKKGLMKRIVEELLAVPPPARPVRQRHGDEGFRSIATDVRQCFRRSWREGFKAAGQVLIGVVIGLAVLSIVLGLYGLAFSVPFRIILRMYQWNHMVAYVVGGYVAVGILHLAARHPEEADQASAGA